jgi:flagellar hook-associated protein 1 FlgK
MGLTPLFDLAARALETQQLVLQTTGHNLANVDRPGYTRQRVVLVNTPPQQSVGVSVGSGVTADGIRQIVDPLLEAQLVQARTRSAEAGASRDELARLEQLLTDLDGGGLQGAFDGFFGAVADLSAHPQGIAERTIVLARAERLAGDLRQRAAALSLLQRQVDERVVAAVPRVNGLLDDIARLNGQIFHGEITSGAANDLRDQRQEAMGELGRLVGVHYFEAEDGVTVIGSDGLVLVNGTRVNHLVADVTTAPVLSALDGRALVQLGFEVGGGVFVPFSEPVGGEVGGFLAVRDGDMPALASRLDALAEALRLSVNTVHASGEDLDGNAGGNLFGGTTAGDISVLITDPRRLAASAATTPPGPTTPEDNRNALALLALATTALDGTDAALGNADLGDQTFVDYMATTVGALGSRAETTSERAEAAEALEAQVQSQRHAVSAVSTNEELLMLLDAQRAFQAAATLVGVATVTLDAVLEMVR